MIHQIDIAEKYGEGLTLVANSTSSFLEIGECSRVEIGMG